jgi:hydrogenase maturation protease
MTDLRFGTLVIGLGSPLMGDDGLGLVALEQLRAEGVRDGVTLADGGTWGLNLLPMIESAERVLFIDAMHGGMRPGQVAILEGEAIPRFLQTKLSPHQIDLREVLAVAEFRGTLPGEMVVFGMEPESVEMRTGLSPVVLDRLADLVSAVRARLEEWDEISSSTHRPAPCMN